MPQLSMEDKGKIIGMHLSGMTNYCIARVLRISQCQYKDIHVWSVTAGRPEDPPDERSRNLTRKRSFVSLHLSCEN